MRWLDTELGYPIPCLETMEDFHEWQRLNLPHTDVWLEDHIGGVDKNFDNDILISLNNHGKPITAYWHQLVPHSVQTHYSNITFRYNAVDQRSAIFQWFTHYRQHPELDFQNFICAFNGSDHVNRNLLIGMLHKQGWYDPNYCSKNVSITCDVLDGHITALAGSRDRFYRKFFVDDNANDFYRSVNNLSYTRFDHVNNIYNLENILTKSFVHVVSETCGISYMPYITEKFMYSIVTRGLFVAWAQPGWHNMIVNLFGFKLYDQIFDYSFDSIQNPIERYTALTSMLAKFKNLSRDDWQDLYNIEQPTIEYNYNHYFDQGYQVVMDQFR